LFVDRIAGGPEAESVITTAKSARLFAGLLFFFALSFTWFAIQSGDVLMYLALARDFLLQGRWPDHDPYLYSLSGADLYIAHEYLSYLIFHAAWWLGGFTGLIALKSLLLAGLFIIPLRAQPFERALSPLWICLWICAVFAGSFRFIERSSLFSDLFCVLLLHTLLTHERVTRNLVVRLMLLFVAWVQLHPGFPLGLALLTLWAAWHLWFSPAFRTRDVLWLALPVAMLILNPRGLEGVLYPFRFAAYEAAVLKRGNFEWLPTYHPLFRFTPEVLAYWALGLTALFLLWRGRAWLSLRGVFALFTFASGVQAVRFVPWAAFALVLLLKPWAQLRSARLPMLKLTYALGALMFVLACKNLTFGYHSSSGPRRPIAALDPAHFPLHTLDVLRTHPIPGRLYNVHDYGSYLVWMGYTPIFHHGFVTDMDFYAHDVLGVFESQERFLELAHKYGWTMLLVDKAGSYHYFHRILSPLTNWRIVAEDESSYLIYDMLASAP
jgi:hypothetical protein